MHCLLFRAVASGTVNCTFVRSDAWLDFSWDLVSLRTKTCQGEEQMRRLLTCHHSSHSQLLEGQVSTSQVNMTTDVFPSFFRQQERCSSRYQVHTQYSIATSNSKGSISVSSLPKGKVMAFSSLIFSMPKNPLGCKHPFPFFQSFLSNQEV